MIQLSNKSNNLLNISSNTNKYEQRNKSGDKVRESNSKNDSFLNQITVPIQTSIQNKSSQRPRNSASNNKVQNGSTQKTQQALQFSHMRANSQNDMQGLRKNLLPNMVAQNYNTKNKNGQLNQAQNLQISNEFNGDIKRILNNQINSNFIQRTSGESSSQKGIKKKYQQIKVNNSSNNSQLQQQYQLQQQPQVSYNNISQSLNNSENGNSMGNNNIYNGLNNVQINHKEINTSNNSEYMDQNISGKGQKPLINDQIDINEIKKSLSDIKLPKLSSQLKQKKEETQKKPGLQNEQRSQSTQPIREQQNFRTNKNNESVDSNFISQTEGCVNQTDNNGISNSQEFNKISKTYDIQQKMITDIENIESSNNKSYRYQKNAQYQFQQLNLQQINNDSIQNHTKKPTQSAIYKQLQQQKYNGISTRLGENGSITQQNILKQSFQISLPVKLQIEKQLQTQKDQQLHNNKDKEINNDENMDDNQKNYFENINQNLSQKIAISKKKNNSNTTQSNDSNIKNFTKKKQNITPEPMRVSADQIYSDNLNQGKFYPQNFNERSNESKIQQSTINQFRVRSQTPNSYTNQSNQQSIPNKQQSQTPLQGNNSLKISQEQSTLEQTQQSNKQQPTSILQQLQSLNNDVTNLIKINASNSNHKSQNSKDIQNKNQIQIQQKNQQQNNLSYDQNQSQQNKIQYQQQNLDQKIVKINNYDYGLNINNVSENQNFRHKTPIKLKINNNSNSTKFQKVQIQDSINNKQRNDTSTSVKSSKQQNQTNILNTPIEKVQMQQSDQNNQDYSQQKNKLQKNNFIEDGENTINNQQQEDQNYIQKNELFNRNNKLILLQKTPEQQLKKGQQNNYQQDTLQQHQQRQNQQNSHQIRNQNVQEKQNTHKQIIRRISHKSKAGCNYNGPKTNQDNFIIYANVNNRSDRYIFSVCDGHGVYGHLCSAFLRRVLPKKIEEALAREINNTSYDFIENSLNLAFLQCSKELLESNIDCTFSGSTCVLLLIIGNKMWSANAGDSRAIICSSDDQKKWNYKELTHDHKPDDPEEYKRIISRGGRVETYRDEYNNPLGPYRVWLRDENIPGLAMARSFGDVIASQVGVTCEPEVIPYVISDNEKFIILASDGVWEFIENEDVMNHVIPFFDQDDIEQSCQVVVKESVASWKLNDEVVDDITCIIIFLN